MDGPLDSNKCLYLVFVNYFDFIMLKSLTTS